MSTGINDDNNDNRLSPSEIASSATIVVDNDENEENLSNKSSNSQTPPSSFAFTGICFPLGWLIRWGNSKLSKHHDMGTNPLTLKFKDSAREFAYERFCVATGIGSQAFLIIIYAICGSSFVIMDVCSRLFALY